MSRHGECFYWSMNLSVIAFGAMAGVMVLLVAAMYLTERDSKQAKFPKSKIADEDENPFESAD